MSMLTTLERVLKERDQWKERHDRERAAHAANLIQQRKVEAERDRLRAIESRLDEAICLHLSLDPNGPGDCTDRLVAAVELAAQTMRENGRYARELEAERDRLHAALERFLSHSSPKRAYYETHDPPHCPTCDCRRLFDALTRPPLVKRFIEDTLRAGIKRLKAQIAAMQRGGDCK